MKASNLETFRSSVQRTLQEFSSYDLVRAGDDREKLNAVRRFYKAHQQSLTFLLEDTQVENPVTNTIFLIHQIDLLVNDYFDVYKEPVV